MLGIERLIEIGVEPEITAGLEWPFPVASLGPRKTSEISAIMARVKYGLFDCPVHVAGKSGVLAALAAHGIVPIHPEGEGTFEGLEFGRDTVNISAVRMRRIGRLHWPRTERQSEPGTDSIVSTGR